MAEPGYTENPNRLEVRQLSLADIPAAVGVDAKIFGEYGVKDSDLRDAFLQHNAFGVFENGAFKGYITIRRMEAGNKPADYPDWPSNKMDVPYALIEQLTVDPYYLSDPKGESFPREAALFRQVEQRAIELG